eukprot:GHVS01065122.1.p1 GENE.GHVS01065122.1~~GHVS01065122.1.p1  ORF type:complete len:453 (+),score=71.27 GHVS01065122.1:25-1359(+)
MEAVSTRARAASLELQRTTEVERNLLLIKVRESLELRRPDIEEANRKDVFQAKQAVADGSLSEALVKRLDLSGQKLCSCLAGLSSVLDMPDPLGVVSLHHTLSPSLHLYRVSCPIGVIAVIFEARPEAAVQIASLCLKSGNALILKGGKEASHSNQAICAAIQAGLGKRFGACVQLVDTRDEVGELLKQEGKIDLVIPRGSKALVKNVMDNTNIPVMGHADGLCSMFVDVTAEQDMALRLIEDSKLDYPAACNAVETLLVHRDVADELLPRVAQRLGVERGVRFHVEERLLGLFQSGPSADVAVPEDFQTEFLGPELAIKCVDGVEEAIAHINEHGSHHTDCIVTADAERAEKFMAGVDSAGVYWNCSTRFADGFRYGFGAEVGISTNRLHARGPVGLEGLVTYRYRMYGKGEVVGGRISSDVKREKAEMHGIKRVEDIRSIHS